MSKVHVSMCLHFASIKSFAEKKTYLFPSLFPISTSQFLNLAKAFRNDYVAACSTAIRSASEKKELGGYVTIPGSSIMTQFKSTADWLKFQWRHRIGHDGTRTEQIFTFKVMM